MVCTSLILTKCILFLFSLDSVGFEDFVPTPCDASVTDNSPLFGLDCEMVSFIVLVCLLVCSWHVSEEVSV